tara:strand:- start:139986 stop:140996 length:1011 start_codon:yes stop_codon:yes gene_type:complete
MNNNIQAKLLNIVKSKISKTDNIGSVLSELLSISIDAAYRRNRGETPLTIDEVQKICNYFSISFDDLASLKENNVLFEYSPLYNYDFSFDSYLDGLVDALRRLSEATNPHITLTVDNIALFQLLNFPHLTRFRLFYWAKSHLQIEEYQNVLFEEEKLTDHAYSVGYEILQRYVKIPTTECYDPEFLKGFMRQIQYYSSAHLFKDPEYPLQLMDEIKMMAYHIKKQAEIGKKFIYRQQAPAQGNEFNLYLNDTVNADNTYYYEAKEEKGIYVVHNHLNFLHTSDPTYVNESKSILDRQLSNSSIISQTNEKDRNSFFHKLDRTIDQFKSKIEADLLL